MSKYENLQRHLLHSQGIVEFSFADIEELLGFMLPSSARRHAAWWSNSAGTHVQAAAWLQAGYRTQDVSVTLERVRFVPDETRGFGEMKRSAYKTAGSKPPKRTPVDGEKTAAKHPIWGIWKGLVTLDPNYDFTQPADPDWGKVYDD